MLKKIAQWLTDENRTYNAGREIYFQIRRDRKYDQYFNEGNDFPPSDFHFKMLHKEIHRLARIHHDEISKIPQAPKPIEIRKTPSKKDKTVNRPIVYDHPEIDFRELPENLQKVYRETKEAYADVRKKHLAIKNPALTDNERKIIAEDIVKLDGKIRANWDQIDNWFKEKKSGEKQPVNVPGEVVKIQKQISNVENYIRRYRSKVAKAKDDQAKAKAQSHLDKYNKDLESLNKSLQELTK